ncbi:hypothetical protein QBC39DRAFT_28894 [Podospora conica]|nr:hypothetical protein QBC39DRAFT_28894 [Schizothecium conicum]
MAARNRAPYLAVCKQTTTLATDSLLLLFHSFGKLPPRVYPTMPPHNHRSSKALIPKRHTQQEDDQRHRARTRGRDDNDADIDARRSSQRHQALIAQTNPREGVGTVGNGYIQSWLKQTQSHRHHEPSSANESRHVPSRPHTREDLAKATKRARSPPDPDMPRHREPHREPDYRFEKRPRHKVREDKYEHQVDGGAKRRTGQKATAQDRTSQQVSKVSKGRAEQDSYESNFRGRGKGLAERAMKARNARLEQKDQEEDTEMDQFRAFFQHRTSTRRPPLPDKPPRQDLEGLSYGNGSEAPWSRASSPHSGGHRVERRISEYDLGSPELVEQGTIPYRYGKHLQATRSHDSPSQHHTDDKATSYVTWSTSHHSEFFDDRFRGPPVDERKKPQDESPRPQIQTRLQSRDSNGSNTKRPFGYKDAQVQTDPIALSPRQHRTHPENSTTRQVEMRQNSSGTMTTAPSALERPQPTRREEQAPEHHVQMEQDTERQSTRLLQSQQAQPVYAPLRRSEYFQGTQDAQEVLLVRAVPDQQAYQEVEKPVFLIDRGFGNRLLLEGPCVPKPQQHLRVPMYRPVQVEDEEWGSNSAALAAERTIPSPGGFGQFPPHENRGTVDFDQAKYQVEGPRQRPPKRGMADFIYEIEREAFDSRRLDGSENSHIRSPGTTDPLLEQAVVPWSSRSPGPRYDTPGPQNESSAWFAPPHPSEGYGGF